MNSNEQSSAARLRAECLKLAETAVNGERLKDYGDPEDNFTAIANLWNRYDGSPVDKCDDAVDVAVKMIMLKLARLQSNPNHLDSFVDIAGYAACAYALAKSSKKP